MSVPSAGVCFVLFEVILLTRSIRHLLRPNQPGLEEPARGLARELEEAIQRTNDPVENLTRSLWEVLKGAEDADKYLLEKIPVHAGTVGRLHRQLGFLGRFELPPELEQSVLLAHGEVSFPYPESLHLASTGSFDILEHRADTLLGSTTSIVAVPAALSNLPLYWPLVAHEYGHRYLRSRVPGNVNREARFVQIFGDVPAQVQAPLQKWKGEVLCDRIGLLLFGGAFIAPALAYFVNKFAFTLSDYTTSHPAPWMRLAQLLAGKQDPLDERIGELCNDISRSASQSPAQRLVPIACASCKTTVAAVESSEIPDVIAREIEQSVGIFEQHLVEMGAARVSPRTDLMKNLAEALSKGLPVDLCFSPQAPQELDLKILGERESHSWPAFLGQLRCEAPTTAELFSAAWQQRLDIQECFRKSLGDFSSREELQEALQEALDSIFYLGENLRAGLRSLWMLRYLREVLGDDPKR